MDQNPYLDNYNPMQGGILPQPQFPGQEAQAPDQNQGEPFESVHGNTKLLQFPDGSAAVGDSQQASRNEEQLNPQDHTQNLAKVLNHLDVQQIGFELKMAVEEDIQSQEKYFEAIANAIKLLGLDIESLNEKEDLPFEGATSVCSTALFESLLDMLASATSSLYPPTGMVDCIIQGEANDQLRDKAYRKKLFFNYYLTQVAKEFKKEGRRALLWSILAGSCYKKVYIDPVLQRPTSMFIRPEDFIVNAQYATHLSASRKTHIIRMTGKDIKIRMMMGRYREDMDVIKEDGFRDDDNPIQTAIDETTGIDRGGYEIKLDQEYVLYEIHVDYYIKSDPLGPEFDLPMPYIITIDSNSGYVLDICRNWEPNDFLRKKKEYFVNYSLLPSLEGEGYGLVHYAGRLAEAATAIKRQLINTGTYSNFPGGMYSAGIRLENNNLRPNPGEFVPIHTGGIPIDQMVTTLPYKEPSATLGQLLIGIEESIKRPSAIINQKVAEMTPHAPVGSVLAMLESLQKVPNAILEGFHESFGQELMLFNERFGEWLPDNVPYPFKVPGGDLNMIKADFDDDVKVIPASNPALQNTSYRFMQSEIILTQARQSGDIHNMRFAYEYFYKNLGLSPEDIAQLLPPPPAETPPFSGDPVTENTYLMTGKAIKAELQQEHDAHIMIHQLILADPNSPPQPPVVAAVQAHIQEHQAQKFFAQMQQLMQMQLQPPAFMETPQAQAPQQQSQQPQQMPQQGQEQGQGQAQQAAQSMPMEMQNQIAIQAAQAAQQMQQQAQAQQPPPPMDPSVAGIQIEQMRTQAKMESEANKTELEKMKLSVAEAKIQADQAIQQAKMQADQALQQAKLEIEQAKLHSQMAIEEMRLQQKEESDRTKAELEQKKIAMTQLENDRNQLLEQVRVMNDSAAQHNPDIGDNNV